jgi:hypothetical protein
MAFHASYTIPETQQAIVAALLRRGLRRSLPQDSRCIVQWAPFSRTAWNKALGGQMLVGNILAHAGVSSKHELFRLLELAAVSEPGVARLLLRTHCCCANGVAPNEGAILRDGGDHHRSGEDAVRVGLRRLAALVHRVFDPLSTVTAGGGSDSAGNDDTPTAAEGRSSGSTSASTRVTGASSPGCWVIKGSTANNAVEVFVVCGLAEATAVLRALGHRDHLLEETDSRSGEEDGRRGPQPKPPPSNTTTTTTTTTTSSTAWVLQEYVDRPLLLRGTAKFHIRLNVLVVGNAEIFVHRNYVCHAATEVRAPFVFRVRASVRVVCRVCARVYMRACVRACCAKPSVTFRIDLKSWSRWVLRLGCRPRPLLVRKQSY